MHQRQATENDFDVGERIRAARNAAKISQATLGEALGVSFQQVQKYEKGVNRVGAVRLTKIAELLGTTEGMLLRGFESLPNNASDRVARAFFLDLRGAKLAEAFLRADDGTRSKLLAVARVLSPEAE